MSVSPISSISQAATAPFTEISPIQAPSELSGAGGAEGATPADLGASFAQALSDARTNELKSEEAATRFASGDPNVGIHEVMIASEKAALSLRYATTLKNKAIDAYRELMNTQV